MKARSADPHLGPGRQIEVLTSICLVAATLTPILAVALPPMTDLAQHILVANIVNHFTDPSLGYSGFFEMELGIKPMLIPHLILSAFQRYVDPVLGAKLYLATFVVFTWFSARLYLKSAGVPQHGSVALAALPICLSGTVYMGFLPFIMTFPLYLLLLAAWLQLAPGRMRSLWAALLLLVLYAFHLVGACAGAFAIGLIALFESRNARHPIRALAVDLASLIPVTICIVSFVFVQDRPTNLEPRFYPPLGAIKAFLGYNLTSVAPNVLYVNAIGLLALGAAACHAIYRRRVGPTLPVLTGALAVIGVTFPISLGILWPAGPRLFPFAFLTSLALIRVSGRGRWVLLAAVTGVVLADAGLVLQRSVEVNANYTRFFAELDQVEPGSSLLPIVDETYDAAQVVQPFWSAAALYNVYRGGANPYVFAYPHWKTGGNLLRYRHPGRFGYAFLYSDEQAPADYRGVEQSYDYVLVWPARPDIAPVLDAAMERLTPDGPLSLYTSRRVSPPGAAR